MQGAILHLIRGYCDSGEHLLASSRKRLMIIVCMFCVDDVQIQAKDGELEDLRAIISGKEGEIETFRATGAATTTYTKPFDYTHAHPQTYTLTHAYIYSYK